MDRANVLWCLTMVMLVEFNSSTSLFLQAGRNARWQLSTAKEDSTGSCFMAAVCITKFQFGLGNNLFDLEYAMWLAASKKLCYVALPRDHGRLDLLFDLKDGLIPLAADLPSIRRSEVPCNASTRYGYTKMEPSALASRSLVQSFVAKSLLCPTSVDSATTESSDKVVIHMRSGDTMQTRSKYPGYYVQPPCSFYSDVIRHGNKGGAFKHVLIVTETDRRNPCIHAVESQFAEKVHVQTDSIRNDACTLVSATNLVLSYSTFGVSLSHFNTKLKNLYIPFGSEHDTQYQSQLSHSDRWYLKRSVSEKGMPYTQHIYTFPHYNTTWESWPDRVQKMVQYPLHDILHRIVPAGVAR